MSKPRIFARDATGLVRQIGFLDQFLISQAVINPYLGGILTALYAPYFFPGAYLPLVFVIGAIPVAAQAIIYAKFSAAMPRSGGDYVWSTRIMGPFFGIVQVVFIFAVIFVLGGEFVTFPEVTLVLSQLYLALGITTNNPGLMGYSSAVSQANLGFPILLVTTIAITAVMIGGIRIWMWFQRISFILYYVFVAVFLGLLLSINSATFPAMFDNAMKVAGSNATYSGILQQATSGGITLTGFDLNSTLLAAIPWGFLTYSGFQFGTYVAGETKSAKSSITWSLYLSVLVTAVLLVLMSLLAYNSFGQGFLTAASYVASANPSYMPTSPAISFLVSLVSPGVALLTGISLFAVGMATTMVDFAGASRMLFAASFDGLLPRKFSDVNERVHTPHWTMVFVGTAWAIWMGVLFYAPFATSILNTSLVTPIGYGLPLFAAMVFYFKKPEMFKRTVGQVTKPAVIVLTGLIGVGTFAVYFLAETVPIVSGVYLGTSLINAVEVLVALFILAVIIYALAVLKARRTGLDLKRIYEEIPPE